MGKTRWEWVAQALLETLTERHGAPVARPVRSTIERGKRKGKEEAEEPEERRRRRRRAREAAGGEKGGGKESSRRKAASLMKYGLLTGGVCTLRVPGLGSGCEGTRARGREEDEYARPPRRGEIKGTKFARAPEAEPRTRTSSPVPRQECNFPRRSWGHFNLANPPPTWRIFLLIMKVDMGPVGFRNRPVASFSHASPFQRGTIASTYLKHGRHSLPRWNLTLICRKEGHTFHGNVISLLVQWSSEYRECCKIAAVPYLSNNKQIM